MSLSQSTIDAERRFIRRGVAAVAAAAIVTIPLAARSGALEDRAWAWAINGLTLAILVLGARSGRVPLPRLLTGAAVVIYLVALVTYRGSLAGAVDGSSAGVGLGSSVLWAVAVISPPTLLVLGRFRAIALNAAAIIAAMIVTTLAGNGAWSLALEKGAVPAMGAAAVCLGVSGLVAELATRRAHQEEAAILEAVAATRHARSLSRAQQVRRAAFESSAQALRQHVERLGTEVADFAQTRPIDVTTPETSAALQQLRATLTAVQGQAEETLHRPAPVPAAAQGDTGDVSIRQAPVDGPPMSLLRYVATTAMLGLVAVDAWRLASMLRQESSASAIAMAGNRMILVLVVTAGVAVVLLPRTHAEFTVAAACLIPPVAIFFSVDGALVLRPEALGWLVPSWRIAVLSASLLLLLAVLIRRREQGRDLAVGRQAVADERSRQILAAVSGQHQASQEAAHELKTPLTVLVGAVTMLWERGNQLPPDIIESFVDGMVRAAERLAVRTELLVASAGGATAAAEGPSAPLPPPENAGNVLRAGMAAAQPLVGDRELLVDLHLDGARIRVEFEQLEHVLENLLVNAHKYGAPGRPIRVSGSLDGADVLVAITNDGGDLTPEDATRIFEPYFRAPGADERAPGTGLGLAVVRRLVLGWDGRVGCRVDAGRTTVWFTVPSNGDAGRVQAQDVDLVTSSRETTPP